MKLLSSEIEEASALLSTLSTKVPERLEMIPKELELLDKEKLDIEHEIEMKNHSASSGYRMYRDLQITLRKRRELKDELVTLQRISERMSNRNPLTSHVGGLSQSIKSREDYKKARTYSVRVRKDLADDKTIVARK